MNSRVPHKNNYWFVLIIGGIVPVLLLLASILNLPKDVRELMVAVAVIGFVLFTALIIWINGNKNHTGDEWWHDNSCSGWRGY